MPLSSSSSFRFALLALAACGGSHAQPADAPGATDAPLGDAAADAPTDAPSGPIVPGADPTFGNGGLATVNVTAGQSVFERVARAPGGSVVVAGWTPEGLALERLAADRTMDTSFGAHGVVQEPWGYPYGVALRPTFGLAVQPDGKILVATVLYGYGDYTTIRSVVVRYLATGARDTSFGTGGVVTLPGSRGGYAIGVQSDGKIVVLGGGQPVRLDATGTLDTSYASGVAFSANIVALAVQPDDKIVAVGGTTINRLTAGGQLDTTFAGTGTATLTTGTGGPNALVDVTLQSDGAIVVAGSWVRPSETTPSFAVARYTAAGVLDTTFGTAGAFADGAGGAYGVAVRSDGTIVAVGEAAGVNTPTAVLLSAAGAFVTAAGFTTNLYATAAALSDGTVVTAGFSSANGPALGRVALVHADVMGGDTAGLAVGGSFDRAHAIAVQPDGKLLVGGFSVESRGFVLARLTDAGALDPTFATAGVLAPSSPALTVASTIVVQADGKIVVGGRSSTAMLAQRYTAAGALDTSFGSNGTAMVSGTGNAMVVTPSGAFVLAGSSVARFTPTGVLDATFGANGTMTPPFTVKLVAVQSDGKLVLAGDTKLARLTAAGALDTGFGTSGQVSLGGAPLQVAAVAVQPDGAIVAVQTNPQTGALAVTRLTTTGALDTGFGSGGTATVTLAGNDLALLGGAPAGLSIRPDGSLVIGIASAAANPLVEHGALVRLTAAGAADATFGTGGVESFALGRGSSAFHALAFDAAGKLLVAGRVWTETHGSDLAVVRLVP